MNWYEYIANIERAVRAKSKDRSTKVGAVIFGPDFGIRSTGFNGFPRGVDDEPDIRHTRPYKYFWTEHAERNAIYNAAKNGTPLSGCGIYVPSFPCCDCSRGIIQSGISRVVIGNDPAFFDYATRWQSHWKYVDAMFKETGIEVIQL